MIFIYLIPHLMLLTGPDKISAVSGAVIYLVFCVLIIHLHPEKIVLPKICHPLLTPIISFLLGALFYLRWQHSSLFMALESLPKMPAKRICGITAATAAVLSIWGTEFILKLFENKVPGKKGTNENLNSFPYLGLTSMAVITLVSKCSPFYAFNDWVDPHTMFTVGKAILKGMVPYKDVFEQKGPLILLIHSVGALISFDSFIGIWLLEIFSCFFFLLFSWRIMEIYMGEKALPLTPVLALLVFTALSFEQGDSAEEFCLPLLAYGSLIGLRCLRGNKLPSRREWFMIGITSGCVLWIKYSMLGFYLGWILAVFLFAKNLRRTKDLLFGICWIAAGTVVITLPILIWFTVSGGLPDLFDVYFYKNMFLYPKTADLYGHFALHLNLANGLLNLIFFSAVIFMSSVLGLIRIAKTDSKAVFRFILYSLIGLFLSVYFSGRFYTYYSLIFGVFAPFGLCWSADLFQRLSASGRLTEMQPGMAVCTLSLCLCAAGTFLFSGNMRSLAFDKEDYPQYQAKHLIDDSGIKAPTLLNYQYLDMGVNQISGLLPNQRFFCGFNLPLDDIEQEQNACIASGCTDFVLSFMLEIDSPRYELVGKFPANFSIWKIQPTYNLYKKISPQDPSAEK